jgi:hypothetical protein
MLVNHGIDNVDERFVRIKETVSSRENVAFEPALSHVSSGRSHDGNIVVYLHSVF